MEKHNTGMKQKKRIFMIKAALLALIVTAAVVFGVMTAYKLPGALDMTGQKLFTLTEESTAVIDAIKEPVRIGAVYASGNEDAMVKALLDEYDKASELITVEYVDAQKEPAKLAAYDLDGAVTVGNGTLIVNSSGRARLISDSELFYNSSEGNMFYGEREITGAIRYVGSDVLPVVYFVTGHGELSVSADITEAVSLLQLDAYDVKSTVLLQEGRVPEDADVLIFVSPTMDIEAEELSMLDDYVSKGGKVFIMTDPVLSSSDASLDNLNAFVNGYGIDISNNYVYEEDSSYFLSVSNLYLIPRYGAHEITQQIGAQEKLVILPIARGLGEVEYNESTVKKTTLMLSSNKSWARTDMSETSTTQTSRDVTGPIPLGVAATRSNFESENLSSRLVVIGDSNFMTNGNLGAQANSDLFINAVNWLHGGRESEIIAGKVINSDSLMVKNADFVRLAIISCGVVPLIMFAGAFIIWMLRRNK